MTEAPLRVTVTDSVTGEVLGEQLVKPGDYSLVCHSPCYLAGTQTYPTRGGTHILTIKDRKDVAR